jgi:hypothetical protein
MQVYVEWMRDDLNLVSLIVRISKEEMASLLLAFDEASPTSPSASDSREIARAILIALKNEEV